MSLAEYSDGSVGSKTTPSKPVFLMLCISRKLEEHYWTRTDIPFHCLVDPTDVGHGRDRRRVEFLADAWNRCYKEGLEIFPETTHIIHTASYYLMQSPATAKLIRDYEAIGDPNIILAGNVWVHMEWPIRHFKTYDTWAYPELDGIISHLRQPNMNSLLQVSSVGPPFIHPVEAWRQHPFHNPDDLDHDGIWYNQFCRESGLPVFIDFSVKYFRSRSDTPDVHSFIKGLRVWTGAWRRRLIHT